MLILITYDVNTGNRCRQDQAEESCKQCVNTAPVRNSVFECILDNTQLIKLKAILTDIIDEQTDSLRFFTTWEINTHYKGEPCWGE